MKRMLAVIFLSLLISFLLLCMSSSLTPRILIDNKENLKVSNKESNILYANITKIIIKRATADGRYYKEFVLESDVRDIKQIILDAVGEELHEEIPPKGGWTLCVNLYNLNENIAIVTSYSDTIIQIGEKYYSVRDSDWKNKIDEFYFNSQISETELTF